MLPAIRNWTRDEMMKRVAFFSNLKGSKTGLPDSELPECERELINVIGAVDGEVLKAQTLSQLQAREPDHLRDLQIELLRDGQSGASLRERMLAAATAPLAPILPLGKFPIGILDCEDDPILSARTRAELPSAYPRAHHLTLESGGHYPQVNSAKEFNHFIEVMLESEIAG